MNSSRDLSPVSSSSSEEPPSGHAQRSTSRARFTSAVTEILICLVLFGTAFVFPASSRNPYSKDWTRSTFYESYYGAAVMSACGRGFARPVTRPPELDDFLKQKRDSFDCSTLPENLETKPPSNHAVLYTYLHRTVATFWRFTGVSWSGLSPLLSLFFALTMLSTYAVLRTGMGRSLALLATLLLVPTHLIRLPFFRDYSKAVFFLSVLWAQITIVKIPLPRWTLLTLSAVVGLILGFGVGFRSDLLICVPFFALTLLAFPAHHPSVSKTWRLGALALFLAMLFVTLGPLLSLESNYHHFSHVSLQGLTNKFTENLGVESASYEWSHIYSDSWPRYQIMTFSHLGEGRVAPLGYLSREYDQAGRGLLAFIVSNFPADAVLRIYASILRLIQLPLLFVSVLVVIAGRNRRLALFFLLAVVYYASYPVLQFHERHYFHLTFFPLWLVGCIVQQAAVGSRQAVRSVLENGPVRSIANATYDLISWWTRGGRIALLFMTGLFILAAIVLFSARRYQEAKGGRLVSTLLAQEGETLETDQVRISADLTLMRPSRPDWMVTLPPSGPWIPQVGYLGVELSGLNCRSQEFEMTFLYRRSSTSGFFAHDHSRHVKVDVDASTERKILTPVYSTTSGQEFIGVQLPSSSVACVRQIYRLNNLRRFLPIIYIDDNSRSGDPRLYQKLTSRNGLRQFADSISRSRRRWAKIYRHRGATRTPTTQGSLRSQAELLERT